MRILQVSNRVPWPLNEGGTIGIYNFTKCFAEQGHEVTLYCLDGLKHQTPIAQARKALEPYATLYIHPIDTDVRLNDAFKNLWTTKSYNVVRFENQVFKSELEKLLNEKQFDVVQLEGTYVGPYLETIRKKHKGLISLRMHNAEYEIWERLSMNTSNILKKPYLNLLAKRLKRYEQQLLSKVDVVIPVTPQDEAKFKSLYPGIKSLVIPAGIDTDYWKFSPTYQYNRWYHLGSLEWTPNKEAVHWFRDQVLTDLWEAHNELSFHLAGKGMKAWEFEPHERFVCHGEVADAYAFTKEQDVCVVPLKSGSGIRLKILEAMAAGKLVVSTTVGVQGIAAEHGKHLLIADEPADFVQCMRDLTQGKRHVKQLVDTARQLIEEQYSIHAAAKRLISFYAGVKKGSDF